MKSKQKALILLTLGAATLLILGNLNQITSATKAPASTLVPLSECSLESGRCTASLNGQEIVLSVDSSPASLKPLVFELDTHGLGEIKSASLNLKGKEMYMGINQTPFSGSNNQWTATTELAVCTTGKMVWQAEVVMLRDSDSAPITAIFEFEAK